MLGIVVGLFMTLLFASLVVLSINYAIFLWESDKISDLTSRIKPPVVTDPLQQPYANRGFTTRDVGGGVATRVNPLQKLEPQQRGMMGMEVEKNSSLVQSCSPGSAKLPLPVLATASKMVPRYCTTLSTSSS